jgi:N-acetylmuramoyl-L-alanine amidase
MKIDVKLILLSLLLTGWMMQTATAAPGPREAASPYTSTIVVIDPGHGGADEGVKGPTGTLEKALMLELARKIKARLVPDFQVRLTRDDDYQVSLTDRTAAANTSQATLMISLHAGASFTTQTENSVVVYLHEPPAVAALLEPPAGDQPRPDWLWRHQQRHHLKDSQRLGHLLAHQLRNLPAASAVTQQSARLPVLAGADLPAVLLEFGDLSSVAGEGRLSGPEWQQNAADAIAEAVRLFISSGSR